MVPMKAAVQRTDFDIDARQDDSRPTRSNGSGRKSNESNLAQLFLHVISPYIIFWVKFDLPSLLVLFPISKNLIFGYYLESAGFRQFHHWKFVRLGNLREYVGWVLMLCGIQRRRPLHRAMLSSMIAISSADLLSSPGTCYEAAPSKSDLASTIAVDNGSW